ncbi:hypothetical protein ACFOGJ_07465 [Marinibaculum pumilum]|uniref:STAS/SEC14 domain-containing protein n=1 Tax=Marinibaculum pumilum TaxID=1766165 RepID=A0ABV7KY44_9PROT
MRYVNGVEVVLVPCEGRLDYPRFRAIFEDLVREPAFAGGAPAVWDLRPADLTGFDMEEMRKLADFVGTLQQRRATRVAMVVGRDWEQPLMRLWSEFLGTMLDQDRLITSDMDDALTWAAEGRAGGRVVARSMPGAAGRA